MIIIRILWSFSLVVNRIFHLSVERGAVLPLFRPEDNEGLRFVFPGQQEWRRDRRNIADLVKGFREDVAIFL